MEDMSKIKLNIVFIIPGLAFSGGSLTRHCLGGSETAGLCMARELAKRGHTVTVFSNCMDPKTGGPGEYDGVQYRAIQEAENFIQNCQHDVLVIQRNARAFMVPNQAKMTILWNHDLAVKPGRQIIHPVLWNIDCMTGLSKFHIDQQVEALHIPKEVMWQTRNGIILDDFKYNTNKKNPKKIMYAARPERGLENLVAPGGIMEQLLRIDPEIHLHVAGYDHTVPEMKAYYEMLWSRIEQLPNCTNLGHLPKHVLYKHYADTAVYAYPTDFEEISCITAMECMRSNVVMLTSPKAALPETLGKAGVFVKGDAYTSEYKTAFIQRLISLLNNEKERTNIAKLGYKRAAKMDWSSVAEEWEAKMYSHFTKQTERKKRLKRHFTYYNDKVALGTLEGTNPVPTTKDQHEDRFKTCPPKLDSMQDSVNYANVVKMEYVKRVLISVLQSGKKINSILDYGCDVGQYTFELAKMFPHMSIVGVDIADNKIAKLKELCKTEGAPTNVKFYTLEEWKKTPFTTYSCLLALDILHTEQDPTLFMDWLEKYVEEDGLIIGSTPTGDWSDLKLDKSDDYVASFLDGWLWNFESTDISDMFAKKKGYAINVGYTGKTPAGGLIGWHFITYKKDSTKPTGTIDMKRKLFVQRPRQTVTLSMIVKNSEDMLHRAIKSVKDIVDDIVIVDTGSTDSTIEIAKQYTDKVFSGSDPLAVGFAAARNETLPHIDTDWIVWLDSDETLLMPENLRKYLRSNLYNGYALRQHHFSAQPANCFKPDLPIRVWRHGKGIKWWGIIHEHVEFKINESVTPSALIGDLELAHDGYLTEQIRRGRFHRNLNLLLRDRKENPDRRLGKFLMMRDKLHISRYELEQSGGRITPKVVKLCNEVINDFRIDFMKTNDHMQIDGLLYYSEALRILKRGFEVSWNIVAAKQGPQMSPNGTITARFESHEDFQAFINSQIVGICEPYEGKYA